MFFSGNLQLAEGTMRVFGKIPTVCFFTNVLRKGLRKKRKKGI